MEKWIDGKRIYEGRLLSLRVGRVVLDDGRTAWREVVEHPGGVAIVPVAGDHVILIRQFRLAIGRDILELPAGKLEGDEDPEERGRRELEEEAGYRAGRLVPIGAVYPSVGYTSEVIHLFLALDLEKTEQRLEDDERIEPVFVSLAEVPSRLRNGEFEDAKTAIGLQRVLDYLSSLDMTARTP